MRKSRRTLISGILALALILTGTGFALWSDTLNVTTTATTGEFDVTFVDLGLLAQYTSDLRKEGYTTVSGWSIVDGITGKIDETQQEQFEGFIPDDYFARGIGPGYLYSTAYYNDIAKGETMEDYLKYAKPYTNIDFNAELVDAESISRYVGNYHPNTTKGSDQIVINIDNMYPGYAQGFRTDIVNLGTLAAKLSDIKFGVGAPEGKDEPGEELLDMLGIAVLVQNEYLQTNGGYAGALGGTRHVFGLCEKLGANADDIFTVGGVDFLRLSALKGIDPDVVKNALINDIILAYPGATNRMDLFLGVAMDPDTDGNYTSGTAANRLEADGDINDDAASQNGAVEITIDMLWDQFNEGVDVEDVPGNILTEQNYAGAE